MTEWSNYEFREYSPELSHFTPIDPIKDGLNWFSYMGNEPINKIVQGGLAEIYADDIHGNEIFIHPDQWTIDKYVNSPKNGP